MVDVGLCKMYLGILTGCFQTRKLSLNISQLLRSLGKTGEERGRERRRGEKRRGEKRTGEERRAEEKRGWSCVAPLDRNTNPLKLLLQNFPSFNHFG